MDIEIIEKALLEGKKRIDSKEYIREKPIKKRLQYEINFKKLLEE